MLIAATFKNPNKSLTITVAAVMKILDQYIKAIPNVKDVEQQKRAQI